MGATSVRLFFFFLMIRRPPRSTLFPTRRSSDLFGSAAAIDMQLEFDDDDAGALIAARGRSEEHTSELQSRQYLVCRLLLEKKKPAKCPTSGTLCTIRSATSL